MSLQLPYFHVEGRKVSRICHFRSCLTIQQEELPYHWIYLDVDQAFTLDKCPVAGTKVEMKITYEEDTKEKGYDSMRYLLLYLVASQHPINSIPRPWVLTSLSSQKKAIFLISTQRTKQKNLQGQIGILAKAASVLKSSKLLKNYKPQTLHKHHKDPQTEEISEKT